MSDVIIFGGTTEGRELAVFCAKRQIAATVCVVSQYGKMLLPESPYLSVVSKALDEPEMETLLEHENPKLVLDATHPYARVVTENVIRVCDRKKIERVRVIRSSEAALTNETGGSVITVDSIEQAVAWLEHHDGNVLATTGSKELAVYTRLTDYQERVYARILPDSQALANSEALGFPKSHIIAMQGPFRMEMNVATLHAVGARYLVTKESGSVGGFLDKIHAALEMGVVALVIGRPSSENGISLEEACRRLEIFGKPVIRTITLVGIGMGAPKLRTLAAQQAIEDADAIAGAARMIDSVKEMLGAKAILKSYDSAKILEWFLQNPNLQKLAVLYSGDTGFYSGAAQLVEKVQQAKQSAPDLTVELHTIPGISTVSYLASRLQIPWQNLVLESLHGRDARPWEFLKEGKSVFLLLGGSNPVNQLCQKLSDYGFGAWMVSAGRNLSYPDEEIRTACADAMKDLELSPGLWAVIIQKPKGQEENQLL